MKLGNMKIGMRLGLGFGLVLVLMMALALVGASDMSKIEGSLDHIYSMNNVKINLANEMMNSMDVISREIRTVLLLENIGAKQESYEKIQDAQKKYGDSFDKLKNIEKNAEGQALLAKLEDVLNDAESSNNKVIELGLANKTGEAIPLLINETLPGMAKTTEALQEVVKYQEGQSKLRFDEAVSAYNRAYLLMFLLGGIALVLGVLIAFFIARSITNPVRKLTAMAEKIALGDVSVEIEANTNDEMGMLSQSFNKMAENIKGSAIAAQKVAAGELDVEVKVQSDHDILGKNLSAMVKTIRDLLKETNILIQAIREGKLDARGNASAFPGGWGELVGGINTLVDAFVGPINVTAEYVERIGKGDLPPKITDTYYGDFNEIKNNLNTCIDAINTMVAEVTVLIQSAVEGRLEIRGEVGKFSGDYARIINGVNQAVETLVGHINAIPTPAMIIDRDFNIRFMNKAGAAVIGMTPEQLIDQKCYNHFKTSDCQTANCACSRAIGSGKAEQSETDAHPGGKDLFITYSAVPVKDQGGKIIGALEVVMDQTGVKKAMEDAGEKVDFLNRIPTPVMVVDKNFNVRFMNPAGASAVGRIPEACVGQKCFSLFNTRHCNTPDCQVARAMQQDGIFTSDTVAKLPSGELPIRYTGAPLKDDKGNIVGALEYVLDISKEMEITTGILELAGAAVEGKLDRRADADSFEGNYRRIVQGVNDTLDAVISPLNVAAEYVDRISKGDIPERITDTYHGDFNEIKNNLNRCIDAVNGLVNESLMLSGAAVEGRLQTRGDASKFEGKYKDIIKGINDTLNAVINPITEAAECLKEMAKGNLKVRVTGEYKGDHVIIKDALNTTLEVLNEILKQEALRCLQEMAKGNLDVSVTGQYQGDFAIIKEAINTTINDLNEILSQVSVAIDQVSTGARQVSDSSQALSQGAAESASSMEQITSSMQEINAQTRQNADNAVQANQLATQASSYAEKGNEQMAHMIRAMNDINESATSISKIIKAIDEIAFQTNLLALNAAVEAARAGKHGKGFTVVAEEVRNLAQRSAKAAKETAEMIEGSIKKTEVGTKIAEETSRALEEIVLGVTKITDLISEIASASKEQALGIGQINQGLSQVDQVTQHNSANSEELASASEEMSSQASQVQGMLGKFKLKRHGENFAAGGLPAGIYPYVSQRRVQHLEGRNYMQKEVETAIAKVAATSSAGANVKPEDIISLDDTDYGKF